MWINILPRYQLESCIVTEAPDKSRSEISGPGTQKQFIISASNLSNTKSLYHP